MAKTKTSPKQKAFSLADMPIVKLRERGEVYSPTAKLRDVSFTMAALASALLDGDDQAIKEIIRNHFEAVNATKILKEAKISKRTFYDAVSADGNPSLHTLAQITRAMRLAG